MSGASIPIPAQRLQGLLETFSRLTREFLLQGPAEQAPWQTARRFLALQGLDPAHGDRLPLGFFPDCAAVQKSLRDADFSPEEIAASELASDPRLAGRLVGPIRDLDGVIRTFWARHPRGARPQYLFKGKWKEDVPVFGLDRAMAALDAQTPLVLVEGLFDVLLLQYLGFLPIAAIGGSAVQMTRRRWQRLAQLGVRRVILVVRDDEPSRHAAAIAQDNASRASPAPEVLLLAPERLEGRASAGEFVRAKGIEAFRALFAPAAEPPPPRPSPPVPIEPPPERPPEPPPRLARHRNGFCTLHDCDETVCFCFD
jgi:DNA primase